MPLGHICWFLFQADGLKDVCLASALLWISWLYSRLFIRPLAVFSRMFFFAIALCSHRCNPGPWSVASWWYSSPISRPLAAVGQFRNQFKNQHQMPSQTPQETHWWLASGVRTAVLWQLQVYWLPQARIIDSWDLESQPIDTGERMFLTIPKHIVKKWCTWYLWMVPCNSFVAFVQVADHMSSES